jgi:hypothetical protein
MIYKMDLLSDLNCIILNKILTIQRNYKVPRRNDGKIDSGKLLSDWYFYCKRHINIFPRQVKMARDLNCPPELKYNVERFKEMFEKGEDVNKYLSSSVKQIDKDDELLSYWGIYHLHIDKIKNPNFTQENKDNFGGKLLFIKLYGNIVFFIKIGNHREWTDESLIRTVCEDFPESVADFELKGAFNLEPKISENEREMLWKNNVNTCFEVNGKIYVSPGRMSSGDDGETMRASIIKINNIQRFGRLLEAKYGYARVEKVYWFRLREKIVSGHSYFEIYDSNSKDVFYRI